MPSHASTGQDSGSGARAATRPLGGPALTRITVVGPNGRADLAVPPHENVAQLLPQLARFVVRADDLAGREETLPGAPSSWVLQRLGEKPMDPAGTPETLGWAEGEVLYINPAEDPLPELDYDDVADGVATNIERQDDRWGPQSQRRTMTALAVLALAVAGVLALDDPSRWVGAVAGAVLTWFAAVAAILLARRGEQPQAGIAAVAASVLASATAEHVLPVPSSGPDAGTLVLLAVPALVVAVLLTVFRAILAPRLPLAPLLVVGIVAIGSLLAAWTTLGVGLTAPQSAGVVSTLTLFVMLWGPRLAVRIARIDSPQLPRNGGELRIDIEPVNAESLARRTRLADTCLTGFAVGGSVLLIAAGIVLLQSEGWLTGVISIVVALLVLLRAREVGAIAQRVALAAAGSVVLAMVVLGASEQWSSSERVAAMLGVAVLSAALGLSALRPIFRRLLPIWRHVANIGEVLLAVALLPLLLHLLGVFAWARGLAG